MLEDTHVSDFMLRNKAKLQGNPFAQTYKALMDVLQRNSEKIDSRKRYAKAPLAPLPKRRAQTQQDTPDSPTSRPHTSDSFSTAHSGTSSESKDEDFIKGLLNAFLGDVLDVLQWQGTELTWPATPHYVELAKRYWTVLQD